jgi:hypothetical protein
MLIHSGNDSQGRYERTGHNNNSFFDGIGGYSLYNDKSKKVNILNLISYILGIPISAWAAWLYIDGWKGNLIWILAALFWAFKLIRAVIKLHFEIKEKNIELEEKRTRYRND